MMVVKSRDSRLKRLNLFQVKLQYLLLLLRPVIHTNGILAGKAPQCLRSHSVLC